MPKVLGSESDIFDVKWLESGDLRAYSCEYWKFVEYKDI